MAVAMSVVGSLLLVVSLFDTLGSLRTPEMRESIEEFLAAPPGSGLAVETSQVVDAMRVLAFVSGALAAMLLVFAVFVLQRHKGARIGFTVAAALLLLTVPVAGLMPVLLAVAAVLIWSRPARDWYAGRAPVQPAVQHPAPGPVGSLPDAPAPLRSEQGPPPSPRPYGAPDPDPQRPGGHEGSAPSPPGYPAYGSPPQQPYQQTYPPPHSGQYQTGQYRPGRDPGRRPTTVTIAAVLTWLGAGSVAAAMLVFASLLTTQAQLFVEELDRAAAQSQIPLDRSEIIAFGWGVVLFFVVWSLIAMVLAVLAFRRSNAARIALSVSAVMAAFLSLLMILSIVSVVTLLMAGAAAVLLFTGGANEWYSRRAEQHPPQQGYQQPPPQPPAERPGPW